METCVMCKQKGEPAENWIRCHLSGGFAIFHWRCFSNLLVPGSNELIKKAA